MTASPVSASAVSFRPETRAYIDGELRDSVTGLTADNINPATEEILGTCTDAGAEDMDAAIAAARRAFDATDWSTNREFRRHCLMQLHEALQQEKEEIRAELIAEVGATLALTYIPQLEWPLADAVRWPGAVHRQLRVGAEARTGGPARRTLRPGGGEGTHRRGGCDHAVELPVRDHQQQNGSGLGHRQHHGSQAGHRDAVERAAVGPDHRGEDRYPGRGGEHRSGVGQSGRPAAVDRSPHRHDLVHRIHRCRSADPAAFG